MSVFLVFLLLTLYYVEKLSLEHGLDRVSVETDVDMVIVEPDEPFLWTVTAVNKKRWMVPYLKIRGQVPDDLMIEEEPGGEVFIKADRENTSLVFYLAGMQEIAVKKRVSLPRRGRYFFRGSYVECGDFFGIDSCSEPFSGNREIVVKPRPFRTEPFLKVLGGYLGETAVRKNLFEDPMQTAGFYEYTGREPMRSISWGQSAKSGRLMVKQYESTADPTCTVLLNVWNGGEFVLPELLERCFSMTRSICEMLEKKKISYSFYTNGVVAGVMGNWSQVREGLGAAHLSAVLEGLGRMTYECREEFERLLARELRESRSGRSYCIVTPEREGLPTGMIHRLEEASGVKALILAANEMEG